MKLSIELDSTRARAAFEKAPGAMNRNLSRYLDRAAQEVAREARAAAPKAFSTLVNSISVRNLEEFVRLVAPGVNYARYVEEGTKPGKMPNPEVLLPWLRFRTGAAGSELRNRAFLLARYIQRHGTKAQPYMKPTADKMRARVLALLREGVEAGIREAMA